MQSIILDLAQLLLVDEPTFLPHLRKGNNKGTIKTLIYFKKCDIYWGVRDNPEIFSYADFLEISEILDVWPNEMSKVLFEQRMSNIITKYTLNIARKSAHIIPKLYKSSFNYRLTLYLCCCAGIRGKDLLDFVLEVESPLILTYQKYNLIVSDAVNIADVIKSLKISNKLSINLQEIIVGYLCQITIKEIKDLYKT